MYKFIKNPIESFKDLVLFFNNLLDDDNGKMSLMLSLLLIPSISLGILLVFLKVENDKLKESNMYLKKELRKCETVLPTLKDSIRTQVMQEYIILVKTMNDVNSSMKETKTINNNKNEEFKSNPH